MKIDDKNLRPIERSELVPNFVFYRQDSPGEYSMCVINAFEMALPTRAAEINKATEFYFQAGRLFVNRGGPGTSFLK